MSNWAALNQWLDSLDELLVANAEHVNEAERVLSGSGFMEAVRVERRALVKKRRERESVRESRERARTESRAAQRKPW